MKITVMIPVYREPKLVADIASKILRDRQSDHEIIVVVDGPPSAAIDSALEPFQGRITVHRHGERLGKTEALNRVALRVKTDVFLFLDNDIELPDDPDYLTKLERRMETCDLVEIPKEAIARTLISRMMAYEFLSFAMLSLTMARLARRSPSMNGAAFAVQALLFRQLDGFRAVMNEDMDFAARAFRLHASFGYPPELRVRNEVPDTVRSWLVQRRRWAMNNILWLKENLFLVVVHLFRTPALFFSALLLFLPFFASIAVFALGRTSRLSLLLPLIFMIAQHIHPASGVFLWLSHIHLIASGEWLSVLAGLLAAALVFFAFARILGFRFNPLEFILYYFVYSPVWMATNVVMFFLVIFRIRISIDWKISGG